MLEGIKTSVSFHACRTHRAKACFSVHTWEGPRSDPTAQVCSWALYKPTNLLAMVVLNSSPFVLLEIYNTMIHHHLATVVKKKEAAATKTTRRPKSSLRSNPGGEVVGCSCRFMDTSLVQQWWMFTCTCMGVHDPGDEPTSIFPSCLDWRELLSPFSLFLLLHSMQCIFYVLPIIFPFFFFFLCRCQARETLPWIKGWPCMN